MDFEIVCWNQKLRFRLIWGDIHAKTADRNGIEGLLISTPVCCESAPVQTDSALLCC